METSNYIVTAYWIYILVFSALAVAVAQSIHKNIRAFLSEIFVDHDKVAIAVNNLLLTGSTSLAQTLTGQVAAGAASAGISPANTAVSANVTANSGVPGAETVGVINPFGYSSPKGTAASFAMQALDSDSAQTLTYTATGLPPGFSIAANGTISGTGTTLGTYTVTVTATDTKGVSGSATFVWSVVQ